MQENWLDINNMKSFINFDRKWVMGMSKKQVWCRFQARPVYEAF